MAAKHMRSGTMHGPAAKPGHDGKDGHWGKMKPGPETDEDD